MGLVLKILMLALMAGLSAPMGAFVASVHRLRAFCEENEIDSFMSAFSGGALLSAICMVLIPKGVEGRALWFIVLSFSLGGVTSYFLVKWLEKKNSPYFIYLSMLFDFIPESILIGVAAKHGFKTSILMAIFIALQNMPEAFSSFKEMKQVGLDQKKIWFLMLTVPLFGPLSAYVGYSTLEAQSVLTSFILLFFSSGILYLIFEDIAPQSKIKGNPKPPLGANLGFLFGLVGALVIDH